MMGAQPFETIVGAHHAEIYRYLRRVTSRTAEAEDLSQETFLRAYRAYRTLGPDANVRTWPAITWPGNWSSRSRTD